MSSQTTQRLVFIPYLYVQGARSRTTALNTTYLVLMKIIKDVSLVTTLGRQLYPERTKVLTDAYEDSTATPYGYLVRDMPPHSDDKYRFRNHVLPA